MNLAKQYIEQVTSGEVLTCKWTRLAVERHLRDLEELDGYYFDEEEGQKAVKIASLLKHTEGEFARKPFNLQPWQAFILYVLYGWKKDDGNNRFTKAYIEVPRKNGKSEFSCVPAIKGFLFDDEASAQIYSAATKMEQAKIVFKKIRSMLNMLSQDSNWVKDRVEVRRHDILHSQNESIIKALSSDAHTLDGLSPYVAVIDEYHAHKNSDVLDVIESGMGARVNPLLFIITTAGFNTEGPCYQLRKSMQDVLEGRVESNSEFAIIYTLDEKDDWKDEQVWEKANPNYGQSVRPGFLKQQFTQAINKGGQQEVNFKTKYLNIWVRSSETYIQDEKWAACSFGEVIKDGDAVHIGVDIASTNDIAAVALLFPPNERSERYRVRMKYYLPEESIEDRRKTGEAPYKKWVDDGWITLTPGNVIDQKFIEQDVLELNKKYNVKTIDVDPWNATYFINSLDAKGIEAFDFYQSHRKYNEPTVKLQALVEEQKIDHYDDPVLRWMISNVVLKANHEGHVKPDKSSRKNKIDGVAALLMAYGGHLYTKQEPEDPYKNRGVLSI